MRFSSVAPMLRAHQVTTLADRVVLLRKLVWFGEQAFDPRQPPVGSIKDPNMRQIGLEVTQPCRGRDDMCELHAIYWFTKKNIRYTGDITNKDTFQSAWRTLQYGGGDCFPEGTLFVSQHGGIVPVEQVVVGDIIDDGAGWERVLKTWVRGPKTIYRLGLSNGKTLRLSDTHKAIRLPDDNPDDEQEVRVYDLRVGDVLLQPRREVRTSRTRILSVEVERLKVPSHDVMTESGRVYLPEADVITRQCDDMATLNAVLAMENGFETRFRITSNTGASWDHIYLQAGVPKTQPRRWVTLDSTLPGHDRFDVQPPFAKKEDFPVTEPRR
jgi:hypothetical protein